MVGLELLGCTNIALNKKPEWWGTRSGASDIPEICTMPVLFKKSTTQQSGYRWLTGDEPVLFAALCSRAALVEKTLAVR
jgi:hypothetical protein